jgi:hypothetical protein
MSSTITAQLPVASAKISMMQLVMILPSYKRDQKGECSDQCDTKIDLCIRATLQRSTIL